MVASDGNLNKNEVSMPVDDRPLRLSAHPQKQVFKPAEKLIVAAKYKDGATTYDLAAEYHCSRETIVKTLKQQGITDLRRVITDDEVDQMEILYRQGLSWVKIAEQLNTSASAVGRHLHAKGAPIRPRRGFE